MQQHWDKLGGIGAYETVAMNDFPNLFYLLGPNAGRGHTSVLYSIEWYVQLSVTASVEAKLTHKFSSVELIIKIVAPILRRRAVSAEVHKDAEINWCSTVQDTLQKTVLTQSCSNV